MHMPICIHVPSPSSSPPPWGPSYRGSWGPFAEIFGAVLAAVFC